MAIIVTNTAKLPIPDKIQRGQDFITKSTGNPNVPGNAAVLAAFNNAQEDLIAANNAHLGAITTLKNLMDQRDDALVAWNNALNTLSSFTESATLGDATKITSAGFEVRAGRTPLPPLGAPTDLLARTNGAPGVTRLNWSPLPAARLYVIQQNPNPTAEGGWVQVTTSTKAHCETGGVAPGTEMWFRVAGVDGEGQGPWSAPTCRPVM